MDKISNSSSSSTNITEIEFLMMRGSMMGSMRGSMMAIIVIVCSESMHIHSRGSVWAFNLNRILFFEEYNLYFII